MIGLLLCSLLVVTIVIERLIFFAMQHGDSRGLLREIGGRVGADDIRGATDVCARYNGMLPRVLAFGLQRARKRPCRHLRSFANRAAREHLCTRAESLDHRHRRRDRAVRWSLRHRARYYSSVPGYRAARGNHSPAVVAAGVSEALVTTAAGLFVAVISVIFFNYFKTRVKAYNEEMVVTANLLAEMLHFHNQGDAIIVDGVEAARAAAR